MSKIVVVLTAFLILNCSSNPKTELQRKYPLGILSDDYGILTENDVKFYADENPTPLEKPAGSHCFWICVEKKDIDIKCRDFGYDAQLAPEHNGEIEIHLEYEKVKHSYSWGRGIDIDSCNGFVNDWKKSVQSAPHVCIGGYPINRSKQEIENNEQSWIFDKIKIKKWCFSKVLGRCDNLDSEEYRKAEQLKHMKSKRKVRKL